MSKSETNLTDIRSRLRAAGYGLLQAQPRVGMLRNLRPDVLAWASNAEGELVPWAVVEVTSRTARQPELSLPALARSRDLLGTVEHYAVMNGEWFKADRGVRSLEPVDGPTPPEYGAQGQLTDEDLATSLLVQRLWYEASRLRDSGLGIGSFPSGALLAETTKPGIEMPDGGFLPVRPDVLWRAKRAALIEFASRGSSEFSSHPVVASAVAALAEARLAGTVLDPFCGTGSFLWAVLDHAADQEAQARFVGYEINAQLADLAASIGRGAPMTVTIDKTDSFRANFVMADIIITAPPVRVRLDDRHELLDGSTTNDSDVVALDKGLRALKPGGRAVFHLASWFTSADRYASYRTFLANEFHVAALIGLPRGAMSGTGVRSVLVVIDKAEPADTFVAQLGEDWETQLEPEGAALSAALDFINPAATHRAAGQP
ncbi:N-6 DNA methylase [Streptomyces hydrogenans]|uniref:N-6 DNA methylase n=1 Tax=Streptomyces hydrogenans TaxID=1873719 RepID=UPI00369160CF